MGTRSTAYAPVLTDSAVERAEGIDLKACAEARRDLATSSLATLNTVVALCDPELLHQVAKDLGLDLAAQTLEAESHYPHHAASTNGPNLQWLP